MHNQVGTNTSG